MAFLLLPPPTLPSLSPHLKPPKPYTHSFTLRAALSSLPSTAVIIGGGLSGLAAAVRLHSASLPFLLLESSPSLGGRVQTDLHPSGFLLDRGFQILLTAYPEARRLLHYPSLALRPFYPGALVFHSGRFHHLSDPFRRPLASLSSLPSPIGSLPDKLLVGLTRIQTSLTPDSDLLSRPECTTADRLKSAGFSPSIVNRFFRPFLGGIFFDRDLSTSSRLFDFVIKCLALGDNALPAAGIGAIPNQLAARLPPDSIRLNSKALTVNPGSPPTVELDGGDLITADLGVVVAVEQPEAGKLLPQLELKRKPGPARSTVCIYFSADRAAVEDPILILNGSGDGIVNNMFFATNVAPEYGPEGKALVSVSLVGAFEGRSDGDLTAEVVRELGGWFGEGEVGRWKHLRTYRIGFAQPDQTPPTDPVGRDPRVAEGVYVCGDHWSSATFDGALVSGRKAAETLIADLARKGGPAAGAR